MDFFLQGLISVFAVVDPLGAAVLFVAMTISNTPRQRHRMALHAALTCFAILMTFLICGGIILSLFSISIPAFQIAGGIIIGIMGLDLLKATETGVRATTAEQDEGIRKADVSITPIAIPMLAGPGAISTVIVLASLHPQAADLGMLALAIALVALATWLLLRFASHLIKTMGRTGINVIARLTGILVLAIAVQFIIDGISALIGIPLPT